MPNLWLPTDDPWEWRRSPFDANPGIQQLKLSEAIQYLPTIPSDVLRSIDIEPNIKQSIREKVSKLWVNHYEGLSLLLKFYELRQTELLPKVLPILDLKPYADFSISRLRFIEGILPCIERFRDRMSAPALWLSCEIADFELWVETSGLTGSPELDSEGRILSKSKGIQLTTQAVRNYQKSFKALQQGLYDQPLEESTSSHYFDPAKHLTALILADLMGIVEEEADEDLAAKCLGFLNNWSNFLRLISKGEGAELHQAHYVASPDEIITTGKGRRVPQFKGFAPKRPRGRPKKDGYVKD